MSKMPEILVGLILTALLAAAWYVGGYVPTHYGAVVVAAPFGIAGGFWTAFVRSSFRGPQ